MQIYDRTMINLSSFSYFNPFRTVVQVLYHFALPPIGFFKNSVPKGLIVQKYFILVAFFTCYQCEVLILTFMLSAQMNFSFFIHSINHSNVIVDYQLLLIVFFCHEYSVLFIVIQIFSTTDSQIIHFYVAIYMSYKWLYKNTFFLPRLFFCVESMFYMIRRNRKEWHNVESSV